MSRKRSNLVNVGRLSGVHGVKGWIKVRSHTDPGENILSYSPWWLKTRFGAKPFEVDEYKFVSNALIVHFKGVDDREAAAKLNLVDVAVEWDQMPALDAGEYYWHQLIGLRVISEHHDREVLLGRVKHLMETGANDVLVIEPCDGSVDLRERLVPYVPGQFVDSVDLVAEEIRVLWDPEF